MKKNIFFIIFALIALSLIGGVSWYYYYHDQSQSDDSAVNKNNDENAVSSDKFHFENSRTVSIPIDAAQRWKTFETEEFSLRYPSEWFYLKNTMNPDTQFGFSNNKEGFTIKSGDVLIDISNPQPKDAALSIEDYFRKTYGPAAKNDAHVVSVERITLNGRTTVELVWMNGGRWLWVPLASDRFVGLTISIAQGTGAKEQTYYDILYVMASTIQLK